MASKATKRDEAVDPYDVQVEEDDQEEADEEVDSFRGAPEKWERLMNSSRGYRSHLTRRVKSAKKLILFCEKNPSSSAVTSLNEAKEGLGKAYEKVVASIEEMLEVGPPRSTFEMLQAKLDNATESYDSVIANILEAVVTIKRPPRARITELTSAAWGEEDDTAGGNEPGVRRPKPNTALRPEKLTPEFTPREFLEWGEQFQAYFRTSNFKACELTDQHAYLRQCMNKKLWFRVSENIQADTPIFGDEESCMGLLLSEFQERYPKFNRRLRFFRSEQEQGQSMTDYMIKNKQLFDEADINDITDEELLLFRNLSGCRDKRLREKLLEIEVRTLDELKKFVTRWEVAKKEDKEIEKSTNVAKAAQVTSKGKSSKDNGGKHNSGATDRNGQPYKCFRCGSTKHRIKECRVSPNVVCKNCGKTGHTKDSCRQKQKDGDKSGAKAKEDSKKTEKVAKADAKRDQSTSSDGSAEGLAMYRVSKLSTRFRHPTPRMRVAVQPVTGGKQLPTF